MPCNHPLFFFFSSRRRHTRFDCDWSSDVCSSDLRDRQGQGGLLLRLDAPRNRRDLALLPHPLGSRTVEPAMGPVPVVFRLTPLGYLTHYSAWPAAPMARRCSCRAELDDRRAA